MTLYAALLYYPADGYWTEPEERQHSPLYREFMEKNAGSLRGGEALHPVTTATTITVEGGRGGDVVVSDGPYAEAKEVLGGFYVLEAADLDEAVRLGAQIPVTWRGGKVEIRPVFEMPNGPRRTEA